MDSDSFYPAFITAARVIGLGNYAVGLLEAKGIKLREHEVFENSNSVIWANGENNTVQVVTGIFQATSHILRLMTKRGSGNDTYIDIVNSTKEGAEGEKAKKIAINVAGRVGELLLDGLGRSSWIRLGGALSGPWVVHFGLVSANGTKAIGTEGWTVKKSAAPGNLYEFAFAAEFPSGTMMAVGSDAQGTLRSFNYAPVDNKHFNVTMHFGSSTTPEEIPFAFIAIG